MGRNPAERQDLTFSGSNHGSEQSLPITKTVLLITNICLLTEGKKTQWLPRAAQRKVGRWL